MNIVTKCYVIIGRNKEHPPLHLTTDCWAAFYRKLPVYRGGVEWRRLTKRRCLK